jgi:hypothetical protein
MTLRRAITEALADNFDCSVDAIEHWLTKHGYSLPAYLRRHGMADYAEAVDQESCRSS